MNAARQPILICYELRADLGAKPLAVESSHGVANAIARVAAKESAGAAVVGRGSGTRLPSRLRGGVSRSVVDHLTPAVVVV